MPYKPVLVTKRTKTSEEMIVKATEEAFKLLKEVEGCKLEAYQDSTGKWTIGYGATGHGITRGTVWTIEQAEADLKARLDVLARLISRKIRVGLSQNQFNALVSFVYNIGITAFTTSGVLKLINERKFQDAADRMLKWNKVTKNGILTVEPGLAPRREAERQMFLAAV